MAGVPKKKPAGLKYIKDEIVKILTQDPKKGHSVAAAMISKACAGDVAAAIFIRDTVDGKPHQTVEMDVDVSADNIRTMDDAEVLKTLRDRMAGIIPKRTSASVESGGSEGQGGDQKPH